MNLPTTLYIYRCYDASFEHSYLVLDDLCASGYAVQPRLDGLDVPQLRLLLTKLAKFHAASAVLVHSDPQVAVPFATEPYATGNIFVKHAAAALSAAAGAMPSPHMQRIADKISAQLPQLTERVWLALQRNDAEFNVITHGDLWSNNVMYAHADGKPTDVAFVDFQAGVYRSPVGDLQHALFTSSSVAVTAADWRQLIAEYHAALSNTLRELRYPPDRVPTLDALWQRWHRDGRASAMILPFIACVRLCRYDGGADMMRMIGTTGEDAEYRRDLVLSVERRYLEFLLRLADAEGLYD